MEAKLIVFILFVLFSIARAIFEKLKAGQAKQQERAAALPPQERAQARSEIEAFLSNVRAAQGKPDASPAPPVPLMVAHVPRRLARENSGPTYAESRQEQQEVADSRHRELDRKNEQRQQGRQAQPQAAGPGRKRQEGQSRKKPAAAQTKPARNPATREKVSPSLTSGSGVSQHVSQHMRRHIDDDVRADLGVGLQRSSISGTGADAGRMASGPVTGPALIKALRSPDGLRNAVVISEILSRPKGLRKRHG